MSYPWFLTLERLFFRLPSPPTPYQSTLNTIVMREDITYKWNWNNATDFANWMTAQVTHKVLSEFWLWYNDVEKSV